MTTGGEKAVPVPPMRPPEPTEVVWVLGSTLRLGPVVAVLGGKIPSDEVIPSVGRVVGMIRGRGVLVVGGGRVFVSRVKGLTATVVVGEGILLELGAVVIVVVTGCGGIIEDSTSKIQASSS